MQLFKKKKTPEPEEEKVLTAKEKRHEAYLRAKAQGKPQAYYKKKMEDDPLYNRKAHVRRKRANPNWQTDRGNSINITLWASIIEKIKMSDKAVEELAEEMSEKYRVFHRSHEKKKTEKDVYRPRIRQQSLTDKQLAELSDYVLGAGLTQEAVVTKTTVTYKDTMVGIDDDRKKKKVNIYTGHNKEV